MNAGITLSILASVAFALMPAYLQWLPAGLDSFVVIAHRIIWTSLFLLAGFVVTRQLDQAFTPMLEIKKWPGLIAGALLVSVPWGLFVWAPLNGETLAVVLGFFLGPLFLILVGLVVFREKLTRLQWGATIVATLAVVANLWKTGQFSWVALVIAISFTLYVVLRRLQPVPVLSAFFIENLLLLPVAIWICMAFGDVQHPFAYDASLLLQLSGVALLGTLGMCFWLLASRRLPMALLGLLSYLEPLLIFLIAITVIGERLEPGEWLTYLLIGMAIFLLILDGVKHLSGQAKLSLS